MGLGANGNGNGNGNPNPGVRVEPLDLPHIILFIIIVVKSGLLVIYDIYICTHRKGVNIHVYTYIYIYICI